jgi:hypothetical protein
MKKIKEKTVKSKITKAANIAAGRIVQYSQFSEPADSRIQVKMPEPLRHHFVLAARMEKKSLSFVIIELLREKYGEPQTKTKTKKAVVKKVAAKKTAKPDIDGLFGDGETEL